MNETRTTKMSYKSKCRCQSLNERFGEPCRSCNKYLKLNSTLNAFHGIATEKTSAVETKLTIASQINSTNASPFESSNFDIYLVVVLF